MVRTAFSFALALMAGAAQAAELFPLQDVRLLPGPFLEAQETNRRYLLELDPDRLLAPYRREAGLPLPKPSYGNWESSGLDGHMGGHYLSALAMMWAASGDATVGARLDYMVRELQKAQATDGYLGGIPGGRAAWRDIAAGKLQADGFSVNGKWVPWYNLHKLGAGLRDAWRYAGNEDARRMLERFAAWTAGMTAALSDEQMQAMLRAEHGGMNELLADVYQMTGERRYLDAARRFSHQAILQPLAEGRDELTGLHANTQIPKVIGFERIAGLAGDRQWHQAASFFWRTVRERRTVAIGGNSVREHFHSEQDFSSMGSEVEGPETCNTYNMLKLTALLFQRDPGAAYGDYYERALYNHILASQRPGGGFVYFTPMRPNHYRVYSDPQQGMWCCVGSGIESHARHGEFIYARDGNALMVNLFIPSRLTWREKGVVLEQTNRFPDRAATRLAIASGGGDFTLKVRYPAWVAKGALTVRVNGEAVPVRAAPGGYVELARAWRKGDTVDVRLPMRTTLEQMPDKSNYYAVLHGPIVLAAKTSPFPGERLDFVAGDSRMGHVAHGPVCAQEAAPVFVSDSKDFLHKFKPVPGQALTFTAPGLVQGQGVDGGSTRFIPFFRLHDSRYMLYWQHATPAALADMRSKAAAAEEQRLALDARTIDQVAPGEQQPEAEHLFRGEEADAGLNGGRRWRHAGKWFSYELRDAAGAARVLQLTLSSGDAGRQFDVRLNGELLREVTVERRSEAFYTLDLPLPAEAARGGRLEVKFVARPGSVAGGLYGLRLLR